MKKSKLIASIATLSAISGMSAICLPLTMCGETDIVQTELSISLAENWSPNSWSNYIPHWDDGGYTGASMPNRGIFALKLNGAYVEKDSITPDPSTIDLDHELTNYNFTGITEEDGSIEDSIHLLMTYWTNSTQSIILFGMDPVSYYANYIVDSSATVTISFKCQINNIAYDTQLSLTIPSGTYSVSC